MYLIVLIAGLLSPFAGSAAEQYYDLGGPCKDQPLMNLREINDARKGGAWDRVIELEKLQVRAGCRIEYRWHELVNALIEAPRQSEAAQVLQEMDSRGFDVNPSIIGRDHPEVERFMEGPEFKASPVGAKIRAIQQEDIE
jgi:hypothetical protein